MDKMSRGAEEQRSRESANRQGCRWNGSAAAGIIIEDVGVRGVREAEGMELRQLECYQMVVETGSISEAARRLHMSQPPLSYQMKKLEEEIGTQLFVRGPRHIELTEAGAVFYEKAIRLISMADDAAQEARRAGETRTLHIGMTPSTIALAGTYLRDFSRLHPEVRYQIHDGSTFLLKRLLESREIEAAVLRSPVPTDRMEVMHLGTDPMVAAIPLSLLREGRKENNAPLQEGRIEKLKAVTGPADHDDVGEKREILSEKASAEVEGGGITLRQLAGFPLSLYRRYSSLIEECMQREGLKADCFSICDDARTTLMWAEQGLAAAVFPESLLRHGGWGSGGGTERHNGGGERYKDGEKTGIPYMIYRILEPALETDVLLMRNRASKAGTVLDAFWDYVKTAGR